MGIQPKALSRTQGTILPNFDKQSSKVLNIKKRPQQNEHQKQDSSKPAQCPWTCALFSVQRNQREKDVKGLLERYPLFGRLERETVGKITTCQFPIVKHTQYQGWKKYCITFDTDRAVLLRLAPRPLFNIGAQFG